MGRPASPLLSVKQTIPPARAGLVHRARLEERLGSSTRLTVVVAPAGWGKTSLLSRWANSAVAAGTRTAWVSLDESDDEPVRFWSYVLTALARASDEIGTAALAALPASGEGPMAQALPVLLNELAEASSSHVLVLDDFHLIAHPDVHQSLEFFLSYLPPTLRVVIASRADPPLPLARMRVRGELTELRAEDLRFQPDESAALVSSVSATQLDDAATQAVWEKTEGWAAGLQLAGLAMRAGTPAPVGGDDRYLFDYFTTEVFPALTQPQRDLLIRAAPLELLSGSLCDAALNVEGSAEVLAELERADLFVVALDREREWFRCHRLLRDALSAQPHARDSRLDVLRRAAQWFHEHRRVDDAVRHRLAAGDVVDAEQLLRAEQSWFLAHGLAATLLSLAEQLPESVVHPQLALQLAYAAEISGQRDRIVPWLDVADRHTHETTVIAGWFSARAAVMSLRGAIGTPGADTARRIQLGERAVELEAEQGGVGDLTASAGLGGSYVLANQLERGAEILIGSWEQRGKGHWSAAIDLQVGGLLALALLRLGRTAEVDGVIADAGRIADQAESAWGDAAAHVTALLRIVEAARSYQSGDLAQAVPQVAHAVVQSEIAARTLFLVIALSVHADVENAQGRRAAAQAALTRAREIADDDTVSPIVLSILEEAETRIGRAAVHAVARSGQLFEELTDRELAILRMLPGTASQREIGAALFISINTVKAYNKSLYRKLDVGSRSDAVAVARRLGLI